MLDLAQHIADSIVASDRVPMPPEVFTRVNQMLSDDKKGIQDIARVIDSYPALSLRLLNIAHSPAFGMRELQNTVDVIMFLGIGLVKNLAMSVALRDRFSSKNNALVELVASIWSDAISIGALSKIIAESLVTRRCCPSTALVLGLLHRVGSLSVVDYFDDNDVAIELFDEIDQNVSKLLSVRILKSWGFDKDFEDAILGLGIYGQILRTAKNYFEADESPSDDVLLTQDEVEQLLKSNTDYYAEIVSMFS
jgi:HD-like signal output (HDOD) protein